MAYKLIGKNFTPPDIESKVTGAAKYAEDFRTDGMVHLKIFASPMPHAKIKSIDISKAKSMPGVVGVLLPTEVKQPKDAGHAILSNYPVYVGQPIVAVAAETEQQAQDAVDKIRVDMEPLAFCIDPLESLKPSGPDANQGGNVANRKGVKLQKIKWSGKDFAIAGDDKLPMGKAATEWKYGDVEGGFKKAKLVLEESFVSSANAHHAMEPRSAAAYWANGKCHVYGSTQSSSFAVPSLAKYIGIKPGQLNLVTEFCGGGFGGKAYSYPLMALPALMSKKLNGRPVMMRVSRGEEFLNGMARAAFQGWVKIGFAENGRILAVDSFVVQDNGATTGFWDYQNFGDAISIVFQPESMRFRGIPVLTNTPPKGAQRGPGENQTANIMEPIIEKAAKKLGMDSLALRLANVPGRGGDSAKIGAKQGPVTSAYLREALETGAKKFNYDARKKKAGKQANGKIRAVGIGEAYHAAGYNGWDGMVRITPDGKLHVHTGVGNLGTYSYAATSRVAAEVLGYDWNNVIIERGGSLKAMPFNIGQFGSNTSFTMTRTNYAAGMDAKNKLLEIGAIMMGGKADDYELKNEKVVAKKGSKSITFAQAAKKAIELGGKYSAKEVDKDLKGLTKMAAKMIAGTGLIGVAKDKLPKKGTVPALSAAFIEIELDPETGNVDILDHLLISDVGQVLHPQGLEAQIRGGAVMGFGLAATERYIYDPAYGRPNAKGFYQAKPPSYLDVPLKTDAGWVENVADKQNPVGAKGVGEPIQGAASSAYLAAVSNALDGHLFNRVPVVADMIVNVAAKMPQSNKPLQINCQ
ncbi:MAG: xanthine dehydrogenase family protein molybdopterin-binding subunit [Rhodospirillaceae bacterium]|jgi:xanthine dehydrogenase molybdenum-binding subunit